MYTEAAPAEAIRFLRLRDVLDRVPVSRSTLYRLMDKREFPQRRFIGSTAVWVESEVENWAAKKRIPDLTFDQLLGLEDAA